MQLLETEDKPTEISTLRTRTSAHDNYSSLRPSTRFSVSMSASAASSKEDTERKPRPSGASSRLSWLEARLTEIEAHHGTTWLMCAGLLLGENLGAGVLSLPQAAARMGWVCAMFFIIAFCVVGQYTAVLLMRVKLQYHPDVTSYEGAARAISGPKFALFTRVLIITVWWSLLIVFLVGTADALKLLVRAGSKGLCQWQWTLIVLGAMVIPVQLTSLTQISWLAVPSSAAIVAAVIVVCVSLLLETDLSKFGSATLAGPIPFANFESFLVFMSAFSTVVFSYAGNTVFLELIHEMKRPEDFGKTVTLSYSIMVATYIFMMVVGYGVLGQRASKIGFIPDAVKTYAVRVVLGVLVSFHTAVAYLIISNPLHHTLYTFFFAKFPIEEGGIPARLRWLLMTLLVLTINFILGNAIPFFDSLLNLIGALLLGPAMLFFPAFFYTQACHNHATEISTFDKVCCYSLMYVITPLFVILCTMAAIDSIMTALKTAIIPFSC